MSETTANRLNQSNKTSGALPVELHPSWLAQLHEEFDKPYMQQLQKFLKAEYEQNKIIFPARTEYFAALNAVPFEKVKVVIIGQDPYHGPNQAHGLCFSVKPGVQLPPSLINIYKELKADLGVENKLSGYLMPWAEQGVLLLNAVLTVEEGKAASHQGKGWEQFTDAIIHKLNDKRTDICFVLWGSYAQKKAAFVDRKRHFIIESPHPSPLSAHRGFLGSKPFSKINTFLRERQLGEINWALK